MKALLAQDLGLIDTTGRQLPLSTEDYISMLCQAQTWRYLSLVLVVLVASDPLGLSDRLPLAAYLLAWAFGVGCYFGSQILLMLGVASLRRLLPRGPVYWPLLSLLALGPTLLLLEHALSFALGAPLGALIMRRMLYLLVSIVMFETIFMRFVRAAPPATGAEDAAPGAGQGAAADADNDGPEHVVAAAAEPDGDEPEVDMPASRVLLIGAQPVPLDELNYLEARQHHVHASLTAGTLTLRTRLADVLAQTRPEDGVQTHRSWWVARRAVRGLEEEGGKPVLRLLGGAGVPVARARIPEIERWIATHLA